MTTMPIKIKIGTDDFAKLRLESTVFVDKSLFIMDMLGRFLALEVDAQGVPLPQAACLNHKRFVGGQVDVGFGNTKRLKPLKISSCCSSMQLQGQFPVISLGFKDVKGSTYEEVAASVKAQITQLYDQHVYLQKQAWLTNNQRNQLVSFLSELLYQHFGQPVYVLIDEYDTPINSAYLAFKNRPEEFEHVLQLFRGLFGATFKTNKYLKQGLITGILRIAKANLFSDLDNVREYRLLDKRYAQYYGFTQKR